MDPDHGKQVRDNIRLDLLVKGRITAERRCQIDFKQPGLKFAVNENVKTEELKTVVLGVGTKHLGRIVDHVLCRKHRLHYQVFNLAKQELVVQAHLLQFSAQRCDRLLAAFVVFRGVCVLLEVCGLLVQAVVGQVHELGLLGRGILSVLLGGETDKTLFVDVETQRVD